MTASARQPNCKLIAGEEEVMKTWEWIALASIAVSACGDTAAPAAEANPETDDGELLGGKCAGPDNLACPAGKFCATSTRSQRCPGEKTKGVCRSVPSVCTHIYAPACGCDGQTYASACQADSAGIAVAYEGPCAPLCGGFAGLPCPGAGTCVEYATDSCDPAEGDADCGSLCRCQVTEPCSEGYHWDSAAEVCACVADG